MNNSSYVDFIVDALSQLGIIKIRKMFGGYGIYKDNIFFAMIINDTLYFKADDNNRAMYESLGSKPFSYTGKNDKLIVMNYWQVPGDILENQIQLAQLVEKSITAAQKTKK